MNPIRRRGRHVRGSRLATVGVSAAATTLLAGVLVPGARAADEPGREAVLGAAAAVLAERAADLGLTSAQDTRVRDVIVDADGTRHVRYDRTYRRLPVMGGDFVLHMGPGGDHLGTDRATTRPIALPGVEPSVPAPEASDLAGAALRLANAGETLRAVSAAPRLVVDALHGTPRLAWRTEAAGKDTLGNPVARVVVTDALDGRQIDAWDGVASAGGDGRSLYSGRVPLETAPSGSGYRLADPTRGSTRTGDTANRTDTCLLVICLGRAAAPVLTDTDDHWGTGTARDRASAAVDAQYGTGATWDYFEGEHGRRGVAGDGKGSFNRVHYGNGYNNAFWDDGCFCMTYGDGDGTAFGPLVSLDVAGHEMSHGVTSATAALTYSGESGGLNEATSDIFGTLVEFHADNASDPGDWLIGEKVVRPGFGRSALRYMDRPSRDGASADCWSPAVRSLDVHHSSGVADHFAYLLAEGSGPRTIGGVAHNGTTCDGSEVTGIGRDRLGAVRYRALTVHMTSSTTYAGARTATLKAAEELYGADSAVYAAVGAAWSAVSVN
ncbi:M4 family metallopeptidase [Streptomyces fructofermentans]|uniref:M4 family metallopeptidase n=1 Tax=Streptomyces fructofermentans TaxID=152141 RepID=UPI0033CD9C29